MEVELFLFLDDPVVLIVEGTMVLVGSLGRLGLLRHEDETVACEVLVVRVVSAGTCTAGDPSRVLTVRLSHWPVGLEPVSSTPAVCGSGRLRRHLSVVLATSPRVCPVLEPTLSTLFV